MTGEAHSMPYRKDIDGLRSVAVVLVILDHAGFEKFSGGYVGVDVFFVISGFLITGIIRNSVARGEFSMREFISRRMKRLLPALLLMVAVTSVAFTFVLLPTDLMKLYQSVVWVVLYLGNFFFWQYYGGYFGADAQEAPLLHTWSLAVEEQFYLIWPIALAFLLRRCSARQAVYVTAGLFVVATWFSQLGTEMTFGAAYYLLPTRFFELLLGAWLALAWPRLPKIKGMAQHLAGSAGLVMITIAALVFDAYTQFPGYNALLPVVGAALIIYSNGGMANALLSQEPLVFVGRVSYSLYLWHWPVLVWFHYTGVELGPLAKTATLSGLFGISVLSWRFVEQPLRRSALSGFGPISVRMFLLPGSALIALAAAGLTADGFPGRFEPEVLRMETALQSHPEEYRRGCHAPVSSSRSVPAYECIFGRRSKQGADVFILGDSHANHFVPFLEVLIEDAGLAGQDYTMDACLPILGGTPGDNEYRSKRCAERNEIAFEYIEASNFDYVVLAGDWVPALGAESRADVTSRLRTTVARIVEAGATPVIVDSMPGLMEVSPKCSIHRELYDRNLSCSTGIQSNHGIASVLADSTDPFPELVLVRPQEVVCDQGACVTEIDGIPLYRDGAHLNMEGSKLLGRRYLESAPNPFARADE